MVHRTPSSSKIAVVTDSTASIPLDVAQAHGIYQVPLQVVIGGRVYDEGIDAEASPAQIAEALKSWVPVSTSRATPVAMREVYARAIEADAEAIVSVHVSGELSATLDSARDAAEAVSVPVEIVDTRQVGAATGMAALAAARLAGTGADLAAVAERARQVAGEARTYFYVDTLDYLRRGGRIGPAAALLGSALSVKPLLEVRGGKVEALDKVRTAARAQAKLLEYGVAAAKQHDSCGIAVLHLASATRAQELTKQLAERLDDRPVEFFAEEVGAVIGAHTGPGLLCVVVTGKLD